MRPATKHYLFFAFLLVSLALLVALVLWQWHRVRADAAEAGALERNGRHGHPPSGSHDAAPGPWPRKFTRRRRAGRATHPGRFFPRRPCTAGPHRLR